MLREDMIEIIEDKDVAKIQKRIIGRKCHICDKDLSIGSHHGVRDLDIDENWDGKSYLCNRCYMEKYNRRNFKDLKGFTSSRSGNLSIDKYTAKGIIGEAIFAKVRKLKVLSIEENNLNLKYDLSSDSEYGIIQSKMKVCDVYNRWAIHFGASRNFDYLGVLCISRDMKSVDKVYMILVSELYGIKGITLFKNPIVGSKWERFRIEEKIYNDCCRSLMEFLKDKEYFGTEDIKKWLELKE